jgi:hypothetical protein
MKENLRFASLGNGITVFDKNQMESGDYMKVAHISIYRRVQYYKPLSNEAEKEIKEYAKTANPSISQSQTEKVFAI